jgi:hypothetical protein
MDFLILSILSILSEFSVRSVFSVVYSFIIWERVSGLIPESV